MRFFVFIFLFILIDSLLFAQTLPEQPLSGPGGRNYPHDSIRVTDRAEKADGFWLFEPASPVPDSAHVVVFLHGYGAINPMIYGSWIEHLVRKYKEYQLPKPVAVLLCSPGTGPFKGGLLDLYENIPAETKLLVMISEKDKTVGDKLGKKIFATARNTINKHLILQLQDRRFKKRDIRAGHNESYSVNNRLDVGKRTLVTRRATNVSRLDAVDYFGYWKFLDALHSCTRYGHYCNYAIGNTFEQAFMGYWSDGMAVKPLKIK